MMPQFQSPKHSRNYLFSNAAGAASWRGILLVAACAFVPMALQGCGARQTEAPLARVSQNQWMQLRGANLTLVTDRAAGDRQDEAGQVLASYEALYASTAAVMGDALGLPVHAGSELRVVSFSRRDELWPLGAGYGDVLATSYLPFDLERRPTIVSGGSRHVDSKRDDVRQLSAFLLMQTYPDAPLWLGEGIGNYLAARLQSDGSFVGEAIDFGPRPSVVGNEFVSQVEFRGRRGATSVGLSELVLPSRLVELGPDVFCPPSRFEDADSAGARTCQRSEVSSYYFVEFLLDGPAATRERAAGFFAGLRDGQPAKAAFAAAFSGVQWGEIDSDFLAWVQHGQSRVWHAAALKASSTAAVARPLASDESTVLLANLRAAASGCTQSISQDLATMSKSADVRHEPALFLAVANLELRRGNRESAIELYDQVLAVHPQHPAALYGRIVARSQEKPGYLPPSAIEDANTLLPLVKTAEQRQAVAAALVQQNQIDAARELLQRAVQQDPACVACQDTLSAIASISGQTQVAAQFKDTARRYQHATVPAQSDLTSVLRWRQSASVSR